jgi:hypothetical protein
MLFDPMRRAMRVHTMPALARDFEVKIDVWDEYAWARGAAGLVLRQLFESPVYKEAVESV